MQHFILSDSTPRLRILPMAFEAVPPAVARAAIEQHTQPGEVILDPFVSGLSVIQAALDLGRKVIAASFNPINALALRATLWPTDARSAFTHLEDALRATHRLSENVLKLYSANWAERATKSKFLTQQNWNLRLVVPVPNIRVEAFYDRSNV